MAELYIPPINAKIPPTSPFYVESLDDPKRHARREHSRRNCLARWSKPDAHDFVDTSQAKALDVFDLKGRFVATYPSSRKAAIGLGFTINQKSAERNIRACRRGEKKQYLGYMFKDHREGAVRCRAYKCKPRKSGYHVERAAETYFTKHVVEVDDRFGILRRWDSLKQCAADLGVTYGAIWIAMKQDRAVKGVVLKLESEMRNAQ